MKIFDTHAHYDDEAFDKDRDELLTGLLAGNIGTIVNVGASMDGCRASVELASKRLLLLEKSDLITIMMSRKENFRRSGLQGSLNLQMR